MGWYNYLACFFSGAFLANAVPHFVHGVSGDKFPTPFAKPPGEGLSSAPINAIWSLFNLLVGYLLFKAGNIAQGELSQMITMFAGIAAMTVMLSFTFQKKHRQ